MYSKKKHYYLDVSDRSILGLEGPDGLDLLQRISTNDVANLKVGEHTQTILTNEKGRIVDVLAIVRTAASSLILAGVSNNVSQLGSWIDKFIVMEDVRTVKESHEGIQLLIFNFQDANIIAELKRLKVHAIQLNSSDSRQVLVIAPPDESLKLISLLNTNGFTQATPGDYDSYRIENCIPGFPNELSTLFNPLEVGLRSLVSFTKGCYVGQEVIARLDTYDKASKTLHRVHLSNVPRSLPSDLFTASNIKAGVLTSCSQSRALGDQIVGLGVVAQEFEGVTLSYSVSRGDLDGRAEIVSARQT